MVGSIWHQHSHSSSEPNKYSLVSSLLRVVPSSGSLALKKFTYKLDVYISKYPNFYAFPWHIEQYRSVFTTESHVQRLDNLWITQMLILSPAHFCPTSPLQVSPKQQRNQVSKVSNMFYLFYYSIQFTAVNNWGGGQYDWPPPLINLTTYSSCQLSPPPNHLISATLTILDLNA